MKHRYWLFQRRGVFYVEDSLTGKQQSLGTREKREAERLRDTKNEAVQRPFIGLAIGRAYLAAQDPRLVQRTWQVVMDEFSRKGQGHTHERRQRAMRSPPFRLISRRKLVETTADDLLEVIQSGGTSTNHFLRCLHNLALGMGWLPAAILPSKLWPAAKAKPKRGISPEEHQRILAAERNAERRKYYELLWEVGAAQTDAALLQAENIDWQKQTLQYRRRKTGEWACLQIGPKLTALLKQLPAHGPLFPTISETRDSARAAEFRRRCRLLNLNGISLHSYRYSWAERAKATGYPERWAQNALGHNSRAVHAAYARGVVAVCPSLEAYETTSQDRTLFPNSTSTHQLQIEIETRSKLPQPAPTIGPLIGKPTPR